MAAAYDVYAEQLYTVKEGLALYEPDPAGRYDYIRIGDVGFTRRGVFHRLFNIFVNKEHPINRKGVPENFKPLDIQYSDFHNRNRLIGPIRSSSVRNVGGSVGASV